MLSKRILFVLALAAVLCFVFAGSAFANFGPHGGYANDTDACAGCHRAHTSFATVGWKDSLGNEHASALLVSGASTKTEFCNACHGDNAPGASTNVQSGVFDSGPAAVTSSTPGAPLNGGGFASMPDPDNSFVPKASTSSHNMDADGSLWGFGAAVSTYSDLSCTDCHDPHGTSNYRLLKATVNNVTVGGYDANGDPNAFVFSTETGYPLPGIDGANPMGGFVKHTAGAAQIAAYRPDYTGGTRIYHQDSSGAKTMSVWCAACHTGYNARSAGETVTGYFAPNTALARHRHPIDINLSTGYDVTGHPSTLTENVVSSSRLPLEKNNAGSGDWYADYIGCLTCHYAHGSNADMSGWASANLTSTAPYEPVQNGLNTGVDPTGDSALLRADNRGVCERCHNK